MQSHEKNNDEKTNNSTVKMQNVLHSQKQKSLEGILKEVSSIRISDLESLATSIIAKGDTKTLKKLNQFIEKIDNYLNFKLTPKQIYSLVSELDLFNESTSTHLIYELRKLVVGEISSQFLLEKKPDIGLFRREDIIRRLISSKNQGDLTEENFVCLIGTENPSIIYILNVFPLLTKIQFLNPWSRNIIINLFSEISQDNAHAIVCILQDLISCDHFNKDIFNIVFLNPYKQWDGMQGMAISNLIKHGLFDQCKDYILRNAKHAHEITARIMSLYRLNEWPQILRMLARKPDDAFRIIDVFYQDYEARVINDIRVRNPLMTESEVFKACSKFMNELSQKPSESKKIELDDNTKILHSPLFAS